MSEHHRAADGSCCEKHAVLEAHVTEALKGAPSIKQEQRERIARLLTGGN